VPPTPPSTSGEEPDDDQTAAQASAGVTITKPSRGASRNTVSPHRQILASKGIKLFAVIDHSGEAHASGSNYARPKVRHLR